MSAAEGNSGRATRRPGSTRRNLKAAQQSGQPITETTKASTATERYVALLHADRIDAAEDQLRQHGIEFGTLEPFALTDGKALAQPSLPSARGQLLRRLGVAVLDLPPNMASMLKLASGPERPIRSLRPQRVFRRGIRHADPDAATSASLGSKPGILHPDYLRGYQDGVADLAARVSAALPLAAVHYDAIKAQAYSEGEIAWGLQAIRADASHYTGTGVKVAILDSGIDSAHPDLKPSVVAAQSFVASDPVPDDHWGHGTYCAGLVCGPVHPARLPRYGVAPGVALYVAKVIDQDRNSQEYEILTALEWAMTQGCTIVSMSIGQPVASYDSDFETVADRALAQGVLLVAAAGNESKRPSSIVPVDYPANCPSVMAVGAVGTDLRVASFSNAGLVPDGGQVDIAAPGVDIWSTWKGGTYLKDSGTSPAVPFVTGCLALLAEAHPGVTGRALWQLLTQNAMRLADGSRDVGIGLVQAPCTGGN